MESHELEIVELFKQGQTCAQIGQKLKRKADSVRDTLIKLGIPTSKTMAEDAPKVKKMFLAGASLVEIRQKMKMSEIQVRRCLTLYGLSFSANWKKRSPPPEEVKILRIINNLLEGSPYLNAEELAEELERPLTAQDLECVQVCVEENGLGFKRKANDWEIFPLPIVESPENEQVLS